MPRPCGARERAEAERQAEEQRRQAALAERTRRKRLDQVTRSATAMRASGGSSSVWKVWANGDGPDRLSKSELDTAVSCLD